MKLSKTFFFATAAATTVFVITILAMVAMLVGDPSAPANIWFNTHGAIVMTIEVVITIGSFGLAAMISDRRETLREARKSNEESPQGAVDPAASSSKP